MRRLLQWINTDRLSVMMQIIVASILTVSATVAWSNWRAELGKRQTDATLRYFDKLMARDYIDALWEIQDFTLCFERQANAHLSYTRFDKVRQNGDSYRLAQQWWEQIEGHAKPPETCGRPPRLEEKLMLVYGRLEALASCARQGLCSFSRMEDMIEAFDHTTVLAVSSYLLLTREREPRVSREWNAHGALVDLVEVIERHVFEGRRSAMALADQLDRSVVQPDDVPVLRPAEIAIIRSRQTRCDRPENPTSSDWRQCQGSDVKEKP
jgi:hypothetical protein